MIATGDILNGRYRLDAPLAEGGFAVVYRAADLELGREVAVKVLHPHVAGGDRGFAARFAAEARTVAALAHPNILAVHDFGRHEGASYLVMPLVAGGSLADLLRRGLTGQGPGPLRPDWALHYLRQAAAALDHAHRRGLVHRDVKPANMLLDEDRAHLVLADFGIARALEGTSTQASMVIGTVAYMAPEQLEGRVTRASDLYALGCVAVELLTGSPPHAGTAPQVMHGHLHLPVPSLAERGGGHLAPFQPAVDRALAKDPDARFPAAGAFVATLAAALEPGDQPATIGRHVPHTPPIPVDVAIPRPADGTSSADRAPTVGGADQAWLEDARGRRWDLGAHTTIGRLAGNDIQIVDDPAVSRRHGAVVRTVDGFRWEDQGSTGGSFVNEERADGPRPLRAGDRITLGETTLTFRRADDGLPAPSTVGIVPPLADKTSPAAVTVGSDTTLLVMHGAVGDTTVAPGDLPTEVPAATSTAVAAPLASPSGSVPHAPERSGNLFGAYLLAAGAILLVAVLTVYGVRTNGGFGASATATLFPLPPSSYAQGSALPSATATTPAAVPSAMQTAQPSRSAAPVTSDPATPVVAGSATPAVAQSSAPSSRAATPTATIRILESVGTFPGQTNGVYDLDWSQGGILAAGSLDGMLRLWRADGTPIATRTLGGWIALDWTPDGQTLVTGQDNGAVKFWSTNGTLIREFTAHSGRVLRIAWSPDGRILATGGDDELLRLWSAGGTLLTEWQHPYPSEFAWSPDSKLLAVEWELRRTDGTLARTLSLENGYVGQSQVQWSPDGSTIAVVNQGHIYMWSAEGALIKRITDSALSGATSLLWSADGQTFAHDSWDAVVLRRANGEILAKLPIPSKYHRWAWSPDGKFISVATSVSPTVQGGILLWRLDDGQLVATVVRPSKHLGCGHLMVGPGSRKMLAAAHPSRPLA